MKTICIYSPCTFTRNAIRKCVFDILSKPALFAVEYKIYSFSSIGKLEGFVKKFGITHIDTIILIKSNTVFSFFNDIERLFFKNAETHSPELIFIAHGHYCLFNELDKTQQHMTFIDNRSDVLVIRQLIEQVIFKKKPPKRFYFDKNNGLSLLNFNEVLVINNLMKEKSVSSLEENYALSAKQVSYYKRSALKKSGVKSLTHFAQLFGAQVPMWMAKGIYPKKKRIY